jgi:Mg2+-importing ATPase
LTSPQLGLSSSEASRRLAELGPNDVETGHRFWLLRSVLSLFLNPLVLILLAASVISAVLGEVFNAGLIALMIALSLALNFFQMSRAEEAASRLRSMIRPLTRVWRDGQVHDVAVADVVPGDLLELRAGDLIAADATLQSASTLSVDEAALTGESMPVQKRPGTGPAGLLFAGTSVVSGVGQALVTATGPRTQFGTIARGLVERAPPTDFEVGTRRFGLLIMRTVVGLVLFVFLVNALLRRDPLESFLFALALAVGLTPEFLPMITTVTLGQGAMRMAKSQVVVKRLEAIENIGSMDVLCSDKTGTLTEGHIVLEQHVDARGGESAATLRWACINSALEEGVRSPLDAAILAHEHETIPHYTKLAELPLDFERRRVSVLAAGPDGEHLVVKGAPESVLPLCSHADLDGAPSVMTPDVAGEARRTFERLNADGYHVLAIAHRPMPRQETITVQNECDLTLCGFAAFLDPVRPSARDTVLQLAQAGVSVKILTGDNQLVTQAICRQVGIGVDRIVLGDELAGMSDDALAAVVEQADIFARVSPSQKNRVIRALKRKSHVVGYIGDGINDAPSLHAADVGISVANGVDVAKAAADIILLEPTLAAVYRGALEGRKSFGNITKYVVMGTSSNFGNMVSMAAASAFLPFLPLLPFQILLNNFLYDLSQITIPTDNVDASYLARPRKWDNALVQRFMFGLGPVSSAYDLLTFGILLFGFRAGPELFRAGWFIESLASQTLVIFVIRTAGDPWRSRPSTPLIVSISGAVLAGLGIVISPLAGPLGFATPPPLFFIVLVGIVATYLLIVQVAKRRFYRASGWSA